MAAYKVEIKDLGNAHLFTVGFGETGTNPEIVRAGEARMRQLAADGGLHAPLALVKGPVAGPVAFTLGNHLIPRYGAVAVYDPELSGYVVAASHDPVRRVGSVIPEAGLPA